MTQITRRGQGRTPAMTVWPWCLTQGVEVAANGDGWWWRCPTRGCRTWAGTYPDALTAKRAGADHRDLVHR